MPLGIQSVGLFYIWMKISKNTSACRETKRNRLLAIYYGETETLVYPNVMRSRGNEK